jgi:hypothetical protein
MRSGGKRKARGYDARFGFSVLAHMRHDSYEVQTKAWNSILIAVFEWVEESLREG